MDQYFGEKSTQVVPEKFEAFGIKISSRYGKAHEIIEMIKFAELAALNNIGHYIENISYDSKSTICSFGINSNVKNGDPIAIKIFELAEETISQFEILGSWGCGADSHQENNT